MALLLLVVALGIPAAERSRVARAEFVRANPCPATGAKGACPGWEVDHRIPLCAGGLDHPSNMQWRTKADHAFKTKFDVTNCRLLRRAPERAGQNER